MNLHYSWTGKLRVINTNIISAHLLPAASISLGNASTYLDLNMRLKIGHNLDASFGTPKMNFGQDLDPFMYYFEGSLAIAYKGFELSYSTTYKSREYFGQPSNHTFGSIMLSFAI